MNDCLGMTPETRFGMCIYAGLHLLKMRLANLSSDVLLCYYDAYSRWMIDVALLTVFDFDICD